MKSSRSATANFGFEGTRRRSTFQLMPQHHDLGLQPRLRLERQRHYVENQTQKRDHLRISLPDPSPHASTDGVFGRDTGVGINLATGTPTPVALRAAVRTVLDTPDYRLHAARMAAEFAAIDTRAEILGIVNQVAEKAPHT